MRVTAEGKLNDGPSKVAALYSLFARSHVDPERDAITKLVQEHDHGAEGEQVWYRTCSPRHVMGCHSPDASSHCGNSIGIDPLVFAYAR